MGIPHLVHAHSVLLSVGDVPRQQLVLIVNLSQKFFIEVDLLDEADDRLLLLVLQGDFVHFVHLLGLLSLKIAFQIVLMKNLVSEGMGVDVLIQRIVAIFD